MTLIEVFLKSLKYPDAGSFDLSNLIHVQKLIIWLENTKIRHYPIDARGKLQAPNPEEFKLALKQYTSDVACPFPWNEGINLSQTIEWLLNHAIGLEYSDTSSELNEKIASSVKNSVSAEEWFPPRLPPFPDIHSLETQKTLRAALHTLHIDIDEDATITPQLLNSMKSILAAQIIPTVEEYSRTTTNELDIATHETHSASMPASLIALSRFPLGFTTEDPVLDAAATVLRMLYIKDLRDLQTQIDEAIVIQQELTANPKTEAAAGRVGR